MKNLKPAVKAALETVGGFRKVCAAFPDSFAEANLPCASYYEISNGPSDFADDKEYTSEISFVVDIWARTTDETGILAVSANEAMAKAGFVRKFAADVNDPSGRVRHKTMRFKILK